MSTPVCIANAVADAIGAKDLVLPLVPAKLADARSRRRAGATGTAGRQRHRETRRRPQAARRGRGQRRARRPSRSGTCCSIPTTLRGRDPRLPRRRENLRHAFPCRRDARHRPGEGTLSGRSEAVRSRSAAGRHARRITRKARSDLAVAKAASRFVPTPDGGTAIRYVYEAGIGGKVASIGGRLLDGAARVIIGQFFAALARQAGGGAAASRPAFAACEAAAMVRRAADEARRVRLCPRRTSRRGARCAWPRRRRRAHHRRRPVADADAQHAPRQAENADRHHAASRAGAHRAQGRHGHGRRRRPPGRAAGVAGARRQPCRWSRWRCPGPATSRPEAAARYADRSRMPIPAPNCRWCCCALGGEVHLRSAKRRRRVAGARTSSPA